MDIQRTRTSPLFSIDVLGVVAPWKKGLVSFEAFSIKSCKMIPWPYGRNLSNYVPMNESTLPAEKMVGYER